MYLALMVLIVHAVSALAADEQEPDAKQWLERMVDAAQSLNYEGTFVYVQNQLVEAMRIIHSRGPDGERQRIFSLNGSLREVIVKDRKVTCYFSKRRVDFGVSNYNGSPFPIALPKELGEIEKYYSFEVIGDDRIAGRKARVIAILPRDELRFGYRLWLDYETGMVLQMALVDASGQSLEQLMFTDLQVKPEIDPSLLVSPRSLQSDAMQTQVASAGERITRSDWTVDDLPSGFVEVMHNRFAQPSVASATEHIVFSDGLATVSVFLERLDNREPLLNGASQMGAMNAFGGVVDGHQVIVVGDAPARTIEMITQSLVYDPDASESD
jgi:sigma-E factor negative regulatory protein RseB